MSIRLARSFHVSFARGVHRPNRCSHGPQIWPWWRLVGFLRVKLDVHPPTTGWRLWIYTRWWAAYFDIYFDRRDHVALGLES